MLDILFATTGIASLALVAAYSILRFEDATAGQRAAIALFPVSQIAMAAFLFAVIDIGSLGTFAAFVVSVVCIACSLASIMLFKAVRSSLRRRLEEERARLLASQLDAQEAYAEHLAKEACQAATVRARLAQDLASISSSLVNGDKEDARRSISQASETLRRPRRSFCRNRVVDALMSEKESVCEGADIELVCSLDVRDDLPFSPVDLCAVFANTMDNAIKASSKCAPGGRRIEVRAGEAAGMFVLAVENTFAEDGESSRSKIKGRGLDEHGWGLAILDDIASRNDGTVDTERGEGMYRTTITLVPQAGQHAVQPVDRPAEQLVKRGRERGGPDVLSKL